MFIYIPVNTVVYAVHIITIVYQRTVMPMSRILCTSTTLTTSIIYRTSYETKLRRYSDNIQHHTQNDVDINLDQTIMEEYDASPLNEMNTNREELEDIKLLDPLLQAEIYIGKPRYGKHNTKGLCYYLGAIN